MASMSLKNKKSIPIEPSYPAIPLGVLLLFCVYVLIWYLQVGARIPALGIIRLEMLWALVLTGIILTSNNAAFLENPLTGALLLFVASMLLSLLFSYDVAVSWNIFFNRVVKFSFMGLFIACFVKSPRDLRFFLASFLLACGKMGLEGVHGKLTGSLVWQNQGVMRLHGSTPLYQHPNSFSGMALGTMPFILYLWDVVRGYTKILLALLLVCSVTIVLFAGSRAGYIAFLLMLGVVFLRSQKKMKAVFIGILLMIIAVNYMPEQYRGRFLSSFTSYENKNTSAGKRVEILQDAVAIFFDHPFGVGVGAFPTMRKITFGRVQDTHNLYLEVLTNLGIQGFVLFFFLVAKMLALLRQLDQSFGKQIIFLKCREQGDNRLGFEEHYRDLELMQAVARAVFLFVCVRLGLGLFGMDLYEIYWWFALGLTVALFRMNEVAQQKTDLFVSSAT